MFFFVNDYPGNINKIIKKEFALFNLSTNYSQNTYSCKSNIYDANLTVKLIKKLNIDLLFIDNYLIQEKWEEKVSKFCKTVSISDYLDRKSYCNFYINYNVPYENINAIGKQWIRRYCLALSKETLGQIRGKFATLPIPGESVTLNASDLLSQAKDEQEALRTELKEVLDQLTYTAMMEDDAKIAEAAGQINSSIPMKIYVG